MSPKYFMTSSKNLITKNLASTISAGRGQQRANDKSSKNPKIKVTKFRFLKITKI